MTNSNRSSYIRVEDQNQTVLNELFSVVNNPTTYRSQLLSKPFRDRGLPESFFQPPLSSPTNSLSQSVASSSNSITNEQQQLFGHRQHAKNQLSLPNIPSQSTTLLRTIINNNPVQGHLRTVSDTAVLDGQGTTISSANTTLSQINSQVSLLPLPDGWEAKQTPDGQTYYIDHMTQCTTWMDPRPSHYAAFQSFCATLPLPDGYEQSRDPRGNIYFIDHNHKQTYWDDPRPNYYRSMMTKRLDVPIPPTPVSVPQSSSSPIPTSSSPFHQQRFSSSTLSPTTSMAQLTTNSPPIVTHTQDPLKNKLSEILNEQRVLQQRKEELERMEADIRKMLFSRNNGNNSSVDQAALDSLIDDLLHHKRQNSEDSGVGEGRNSMSRTPDALSSTDYADDTLFQNQADYATIPVGMEIPVQDHRPIIHLEDSQLKMLLRINAQIPLNDACYSLRYSPHLINQLAIVACENYGIRGRSTIQVLINHEKSIFNWSDAIFDVSFVETDPSLIVSASGDGSILLWQLNQANSLPLLTLREHQREVWCVHWSESRSNDALLSTSADGTIKLWSFMSSPIVQATLSGHESVVYEARWHPRRQGLIASVSADCSLRLFDVNQSSNIFNPRAHPAEILSLDWSKYDDHLLVTGACDNRLRLWDIRMITNALSVFEGHEGAIRRVRFDPYRRDRLASTGYDGQLKLWHITPTSTNMNIHTERFSKDFIYGLDWNLFESDKLAVGAWDRIVRFCEIVSM